MVALDDYIQAKEELKRAIGVFDADNRAAVGVGLRKVAGRRTRDVAVQVYLSRKLPVRSLTRNSRLPAAIDGIPVDVNESAPPLFMGGHGRPTAASVRRKVAATRGRSRIRPLRAGVSCSNRFVNSGTLGYFCVSHAAGRPSDALYLLGTAHVFESGRSRTVVQAAPADGGTDRDAIAETVKSIGPTWDPRQANRVDAAIARVRTEVPVAPELLRLGAVTGVCGPAVGMKVLKEGRSTGVTAGRIVSVDYETRVSFQYREQHRPYCFAQQIRIEPSNPEQPFAQFGDSGSLVVSDPGTCAVGLYFAGAYDGSYGLATPIEYVQDALEISLLGTTAGA